MNKIIRFFALSPFQSWIFFVSTKRPALVRMQNEKKKRERETTKCRWILKYHFNVIYGRCNAFRISTFFLHSITKESNHKTLISKRQNRYFFFLFPIHLFLDSFIALLIFTLPFFRRNKWQTENPLVNESFFYKKNVYIQFCHVFRIENSLFLVVFEHCLWWNHA